MHVCVAHTASTTGLAVTIGLVFSPVNVKLAAGLDQTACGLSTAMIGFFVNITITVLVGLLLQHRPQLLKSSASLAPSTHALDIGRVRDAMLSPWLWAAMVTVLLFTTPFYRVPLSPDVFVGDMSSWAFVALMLSGVLAVLVSFAYQRRWTTYECAGGALPCDTKDVDTAVPAVPPSQQQCELSGSSSVNGGAAASKDVAAAH
jgi:hypothetical protein